jgi:hypothetical protein
MIPLNTKFIIIIIIIGTFTIFSGCSSQQKNGVTIPAPLVQPSNTASLSRSVDDQHWIRMDPLDIMQKGKTILISGTTNLPAGTDVRVGYSMLAHSCPPPKVPDKTGERTFCGGSCRPGEESNHTVRIIEGSEGVNSWNVTVNTTNWCTEIYGIGAYADSGTDTLHVGQQIRFSPG